MTPTQWCARISYYLDDCSWSPVTAERLAELKQYHRAAYETYRTWYLGYSRPTAKSGKALKALCNHIERAVETFETP